MTHETVVSLRQIPGEALHISATPVEDEVANVGRVIDVLTATGMYDQLRPATPDNDGVITRQCAPDVTIMRAANMLVAQGYQIVIDTSDKP